MPFIVKNTSFPSFSDLLFPYSCRGCEHLGTPLCEHCKKYILSTHIDYCPNCKTKKTKSKCPNCHDLPPIYVVSDRNGLIGKLIHDYKYNSVRALSQPLAELLSEVLPKDLPKNAFLVPIPTATHHIRSRGFDHTLLLAKRLSRIRNIKTKPILLRAKNTVQVGSNRSERLSKAANAYEINPKIIPEKDATYILIDDVWTTGASDLSAISKLQSTGIKNIIVALLAYSSN